MTLAKKLRPWTEQAMKIEVAPWIRDYVVNMDELYTELTLEKAECKLDGEKCWLLQSYKEVFEIPNLDEAFTNTASEGVKIKFIKQSKQENETRCHKAFKCVLCCTVKYDHEELGVIEKVEGEIEKVEEVKEGKKILFKGEPGMGKTTVGKKIGWDWEMGIFKTFQIVFFVFLKFVRPGYSIENTIIQQTPVLKGLGITQEKLTYFLEEFGHKCLLILDGFDECALGQNQDVVGIVRGEKLFKCNILLTSRPHTTREIAKYFQTVVKVTGFTQNQARKFAFKILNNQRLVADVLRFTPLTLTENDTKLYQCPILLSFLCLLVRENEINLSDKAISVGEIYTRMVRCLYRKFTIRRNINFDETKFVETMKRIGKIAFKALLSGNPLLKRSEVVKEVDEEVFDYGLLIGHEDAYRLIRDETADIFITFPHRSIQEFLGALFFVLMLSSSTMITTLFEGNKSEPIFLTNPLFLDFCLWFLCDKNCYIPIDGKDVILTTLAELCAEASVSSFFHTEHITQLCPVLDLRRAEKKNDELIFAFYRKFLEKFENTNTIVLDFRYPREWILEAMIQNCENIRHINIKGVFSYFACTRNCTIKVFMKTQGKLPDCLLHLITKECLKFGKPASVQFFQRGESLCDLTTACIIPFGRFVTHLCVMSCCVSEEQLQLLAEAVVYGEMSRLSDLSFISCKILTLSPFLEIKWPHLNHLKFQNCNLGKLNCQSLAEAVSYTCIHLTSLAVVDRHVDHFVDTIVKHGLLRVSQLFLGFSWRNYTAGITKLYEATSKMPNLSNLFLLGMQDSSCVFDLVKALPLASLALSNFVITRDELMQVSSEISRVNLSELNLTDCPNVGGNLSALLSGSFPSLHTLTTRQCNLNSQDLDFLTRASVEGKLPGLKCLDISLNADAISIKALFTNNCRWNELLSLNILHTFCEYYEASVPSNCFSSLQHLSVSDGTLYYLLCQGFLWQCLQSLHVFRVDGKTMRHIVKAEKQHLLPTLESLCVDLGNVERSVFDIDATRELRNVSVHDAESFPDDLQTCSWGCVCCEDRRIINDPKVSSGEIFV